MTNVANEIRTKIESEMLNRFGQVLPISVSHADFGESMYIQNQGYGKIRISDHSVSNINRIFNEEHYHFSSVLNMIDSLMEDVEIIFFPERFTIIKVDVKDTVYSTTIFASIEDFNNRTHGAEIVENKPFITKKGVEKMEITFKYDLIKQVNKKVRI